MAFYTCPKCDILLRKGSWELYTHCPDCDAPWLVDPQAGAKNLRRIRVLATLFAILSLVPFLGVVFGIMAVFWGYLAIKFRYTVLGVFVMLFAAIVGLVGQASFSWWAIGKLADRQCDASFHSFADSIRTYHSTYGVYPPHHEAITRSKLEAANGCLYGGKYFYLPPWGWQVTEISSHSPPAVAVGLKKDKEPAKMIAAVYAAKMPAEWASKPPEEWKDILKAAGAAPTTPELTRQWATTAPATQASGQTSTQAAKESAAAVPSTSQAASRPNPQTATTVAEAASDTATTAPGTAPSATASFAESDLATLIMVAETKPTHRYTRTAIFADGSMKVMKPEEFEKLLLLPQNAAYAKLLVGAKKVKESNKPSKGGH